MELFRNPMSKFPHNQKNWNDSPGDSISDLVFLNSFLHDSNQGGEPIADSRNQLLQCQEE